MSQNLTCNQVSALLSFYIKDSVSSQIKSFIERHLEICPVCREKYIALKAMLDGMHEAHDVINNMDERQISVIPISAYSKSFLNNLSAYVDNELSDEENIKFKKYAIANQPVRRELENIYRVKNLIQSSVEKTKGELKDDFAKSIIIRLNFADEVYTKDPLLKVITIMFIVMTFFALGALAIMWI